MKKKIFVADLWFVFRAMLLAALLFTLADARFAHAQSTIYAEHWTTQEAGADLYAMPIGGGHVKIDGGLEVLNSADPSILAPSMDTATMNTYSGSAKVIYNTDDLEYKFHNGVGWQSLGGGGSGSGISLWQTATTYNIDDVVIESDKIYIALTNHSSTVFQTDYGNGDWKEISAIDFANNLVTGDLAEEHGGTGNDLSGVAAGSLFYQSAAAQMGQLIGYAVNSYNGINAIHSKTVADPGAPTTETHQSYQLNVDVSSAGGNLYQNTFDVTASYGGTNDLATLNGGSFATNTAGSGTLNYLSTLNFNTSAGDGTNPGTTNTVQGLYGNVAVNNGYSAPMVKVMDINGSTGTGVTNADFIGQNLNMQINSPVTNSFNLVNGGVTFNAGATANNVSMFSANPLYQDAISGNSTGFTFNPTHNSTSNGTFSFYTNPQYNDTAAGMTGIYIGGNGTDAPGSYVGAQVQSNFAGTGTTATGVSGQINHDVTGAAIGLQSNLSGDGASLSGMDVSISGTSSNNLYGSNIGISGDSVNAIGLNVNMTGTYSGNAAGISVDVTGSTVPSDKPVAINASGVINGGFQYDVPSTGTSDAVNQIATIVQPTSVTPVSTDLFGVSTPLVLAPQSDMTVGAIGVGLSSQAYIVAGQIPSAKNIQKLNGATSAFADIAGVAGSNIDEYVSYESLGALSFGGSTTVGRSVAFKLPPETLPRKSGDRYGVLIEDVDADNYFKKNVIIGTATEHTTNDDIALEIDASAGLVKLPEYDTAGLAGVTAVESMFAYDTDEHTPTYYNGSTWISVGTSSGLTLSPNAGIRTDAAGDAEAVTQNNGEILIGKTGDKPQAGSIVATANQTTVTYSTPNVVIGTAQNIGTTSSVTFGNVTDSALTSGRVTFAGAGGLLSDDAGMTYNSGTDALTVTGSITTAAVTDSGLTSGRLTFASTGGLLADDAGLTYNSGTDALTVSGSITDSGLTATRVLYAGTGGLLSDDSGMTYNAGTDALTVTGSVTTAAVTDSGLTSGRLTFASTGGLLADDAGLTYNSGTDALTVTGSVTVSGLTATRVVYSGTGGLLSDDAGMTYTAASDLLTVGATSATSTTLASIPNNPVTTTQRLALTPSTGSCVYDTDYKAQMCYDGTNWTIQGSEPESAFVAETYFAGTANCRWNTTSASYGDFTADTDCASPTNRGTATTSDKQPEILIPSLAAGDYIAHVVMRSNFITATTECEYKLTDGTTSWPISAAGSSSGGWTGSGNSVPIRLTGTQTNYNLRVQGKKFAGSGACAIYADSSDTDFKITLIKVASFGSYSIPSEDSHKIKWTNVASCAPQVTAGSYTTFDDDDCSFASATKVGAPLTPSTTGEIALKIASVKAGYYWVNFDGYFQTDAASGSCSFRATDGTNVVGPTANTADASANSFNPGAGELVYYAADQTNLEWKIQGKLTSGATACKLNGSTDNVSMSLSLMPISRFVTGSNKDVPTIPSTPNNAPKICVFDANSSTDLITVLMGDCFTSTTLSGTGGTGSGTFKTSYWTATPKCFSDSGVVNRFCSASASSATAFSMTRESDAHTGNDGNCQVACFGY